MITPAKIEAEILSEHYFTGEEGMLGAYRANNAAWVGSPPSEASDRTLPWLTFCVLILRNGFVVTGESICVNPDTFNAELYRRMARQSAFLKVAPLMDYAQRGVKK